MQKPLRCIVNHKDKGTYYTFSIKDAMVTVLLLVDVQYSPFGVVKWNVLKAIRMVQEFCKLIATTMSGPDKGQVTRTLTSLDKGLTYILKSRNRKELCRRYYDLILSMEGLSTLPGFGMANLFGDKIYGNPEKKSILKVDNLLKKG